MVKAYKGSFARHTLLLPMNLRLGNASAAHPWLRGDLKPSPAEDQDDEAYVYWEALEPKEVDSSQTWALLWEVSRGGKATPQDIIAFTERWGMLASDWDYDAPNDYFWDPSTGAKQGALSCDAWRAFADTVQRLLLLLADTSAEQVVDLSLLEQINHWDDLPDIPELNLLLTSTQEEQEQVLRRLGTDSIRDGIEEYHRRQEGLRWQQLLDERRQGHGVEQQRRLLCNKLNGLFGMQYAFFSWDHRGRRMEREAIGLAEIALSHIAAMFTSAEADVLVCSVCGQAFPFDESSSGRRPRFGARRFCSDDCRREGKLESNRESWRRNSTRWRPRKPKKGQTGG